MRNRMERQIRAAVAVDNECFLAGLKQRQQEERAR